MSKPDPIDWIAQALQDQVNEAIRVACAGRSTLRYRAVAEREAERLIDPDKWDYLWRESMGAPPQVTITGYKGS